MAHLVFTRRAIPAFAASTLSLMAAACNETTPPRPEVLPNSANTASGRIDQAFLYRLNQIEDTQRTLFVGSYGGEAIDALAAADLIEARFDNVMISALCLSACAEVLMLTDLPTYAFNQPVIGFHHNPTILNHLAHELDRGSVCRVSYLDRFAEYQQSRGVPPDTWRHQMDILDYDIEPWRGVPRLGCGDIVSAAQVDYWLPTSKELRDWFGLGLSGPVCADSPSCLSQRLPLLLSVGTVVSVRGEQFEIVDAGEIPSLQTVEQ
jgi:hypothetical protein